MFSLQHVQMRSSCRAGIRFRTSIAARRYFSADVSRLAAHERRWLTEHVQQPAPLGIAAKRSRAALRSQSSSAEPNQLLNEAQTAELARLAALRMQGHPLQYLLGNVDFCGLTLRTQAPVLIPRPETECLTWWLIDKLVAASHDTAQHRSQQAALRVLDLCSGSGNIALALAAHLPAAQVIGLDVSDAALQLANDNLRTIGVRNCSFARADILRGTAIARL